MTIRGGRRGPSRLTVTMAWTAVAALAGLGVVLAGERAASVLGDTSTSLFPGPEGFDELYHRRPGVGLLHVLPGLAFMILGPLQLTPAIRDRFPVFHRWSGRVFLLASGCIAVTAIILGVLRPFGGPLETAATFVFTAVFVVSLGMAFRHVRRREYAAHREWMIRGFAVGLGVATIRPVAGVAMAVTGRELADVLGIAFWIAFSLHLLAAQLWIVATRGGRGSVPAALLVLGAGLGASACDLGRAADTGPRFEEHRIEVGPSTAAVVARDFDGDGHPDLAAAHRGGDGSVTLLRGDGAGGFRPWSVVPAGENPVDLALGDFDEDGRVDLAVPNHETGYVTVLFGTEDGGFARDGRSTVSVAVEPHPHTVAVGDVDEDGHLDLLVDHRAAAALLLLAGSGDGTFRDAGTIPVGGDPYRWVSLADRDGDGHLDLAVPVERSVALLRGTDDGTFEPEGSVDASGLDPFLALETDVDGDGRLDLAVGGGEGVDRFDLWLRGEDGGYRRAAGAPFRLAAGPMRAAAGELNGDGRPDFVVTAYVGGEVGLLLSGPEGFRLERIPVRGNPYAAAIGDLDGDGRPDFVTANDGSGDLSVFLRVGEDP